MDDSLIIQNYTNVYWTQRWRNFKILFTGLEWVSSLNSKFSHIFFEQVMFFYWYHWMHAQISVARTITTFPYPVMSIFYFEVNLPDSFICYPVSSLSVLIVHIHLYHLYTERFHFLKSSWCPWPHFIAFWIYSWRCFHLDFGI